VPYKYGTTVLGYGNGHWLERPPRNRARSDILNLTMFDAGHGDPEGGHNPILRGLGMTVILELNQYTRNFEIELRYNDGTTTYTRNLKPLFQSRGSRRYEMRTYAGDPDGLGFSVITDNDYAQGVHFTLALTFTNITRTSRVEYQLDIADESEPARCPVTEETEDFEMFELFQREGFRFWKHVSDPTYDFASGQRLTMFVPDISAFLTASMITALNWQAGHHTGVVFTRDADGDGIGPGFAPNDGNPLC